jgi:hypothetical protein
MRPTGKEKIAAAKGFFGSWYATFDGKLQVCSHYHRTRNGAIKCGKELARFLQKVEKIKKERELK